MNNIEKYIKGDENVQVPAHLSFGKFMLDALRRREDEIAIVSTIIYNKYLETIQTN